MFAVVNRLIAEGRPIEGMPGHISWAMGQTPERVRAQIQSDSLQVRAAVQQITDHGMLANIFGHVKNARLITDGRPIEDMHGHINWSLGQTPDTVRSVIRSAEVIALLTNLKL